MKLLSDNFMKSASQQTLDDAEAWLTTALYGGASEKQLRQLARAMEMLYERGVTDTLSKYAPQILQEDLIPSGDYAVMNGTMYPTGKRGL